MFNTEKWLILQSFGRSLIMFGKWNLVIDKGPFKYYVIKEVGGWGQKIAILDDLRYCKSSKSWIGGPKKVKNMMT